MTGKRDARGRPPARNLPVVFIGAGGSKAEGLPLTQELLSERLWPRRGHPSWCYSARETQRVAQLRKATQLLYPEADAPNFRPPSLDFFASLDVLASAHPQPERLPIDASGLLDDLRRDMAIGLLRETRRPPKADSFLVTALSAPDRPKIVITSNWDHLIEVAAMEAGLRTHLAWPRDPLGAPRAVENDEIVVLKLHGSVDWGLARDWTLSHARRNVHYNTLRTPVGRRMANRTGRPAAGAIWRRRFLEEGTPPGLTDLGFTTPFMVTMAHGKSEVLTALRTIWGDALWALRKAKTLGIVGYSFPTDDLEIRTLLRSGCRQPGQSSVAPQLTIMCRNPDPEAHERARRFIGSDIVSDYSSA